MTASLLRIALALLSLGLCGVLEATISCRNEEGDAVDWFTFYKLPKRQDQESRKTGLEYLYLDSTTRSWRRSKHLMNTTKSALGRTLEQLYEAYASKNNNTAYLMYNDGVPKSVNYSRKYGHTKDSQLLVCNPNIYSCSIPAMFHQELAHMPQLCARSSPSEIPGRHLASLQSAHGQNFLHFAKSDSFLDDIFVAWMAQHLKTHLLTETWQRKRQQLPSNCSLPYHVYNIKAIKISGHSYFSSHQDHAKWCVSQKRTKNRWTCIGDLNRSPYQALRSGGFICTQNQHIYQAFQGLVLYYENCN
ncbi:deoxyribonuclease-2-beta isoform X2 [Phyllostomus hastatus]|uniref:deoxyribonuclease-2-beta isoform X2 n=1 Tax=Phyllostomus hastatus TaxID=9423 RepID=UPI001E684884|nr:deoxyribonuclease-2-beta isoform X2 [Phyllostomus hastatus]